MGLTAIIGGEFEVPLASNLGWGDVGRFISESEEDAPLLRHLIEYGWTQGAQELVDEIEAITEQPIPSSIEKTLLGLAEAIGQNPQAETVVVTNGFVPDDGEDETSEPDEQGNALALPAKRITEVLDYIEDDDDEPDPEAISRTIESLLTAWKDYP